MSLANEKIKMNLNIEKYNLEALNLMIDSSKSVYDETKNEVALLTLNKFIKQREEAREKINELESLLINSGNSSIQVMSPTRLMQNVDKMTDKLNQTKKVFLNSIEEIEKEFISLKKEIKNNCYLDFFNSQKKVETINVKYKDTLVQVSNKVFSNSIKSEKQIKTQKGIKIISSEKLNLLSTRIKFLLNQIPTRKKVINDPYIIEVRKNIRKNAHDLNLEFYFDVKNKSTISQKKAFKSESNLDRDELNSLRELKKAYVKENRLRLVLK